MIARRVIVLAALIGSPALLSASDPINCAQCQNVLKDGAFNTRTLSATSSSKDAFRAWQCTTEFSTHDEAHAFGVDIGIPIYEVPVQLGGTFSDSQRETWKKNNCSDIERKASTFSALSSAVKEASPEILAAWTHCIDVTCDIREAIECSTETLAKGILFKARWRRSTGDNSPPSILSFRALDAACDKPLKTKSKLSEAFTSTVCKPSAPEDVVFILETTRGSCTPVQTGFKEDSIIEGRRVLSRDTNIKADRITLKDAEIVTNGFDLTLEATSLRLVGAPHIVAFEAKSGRLSGEDGRNAGKVQIVAKTVEGTTLKIRNDGEDGVKGEDGRRGRDGQQGQQGQQRTFSFGCSSGSNGTQGGNGERGENGFRGGRGGAGGRVIIQTSSPLTAGGICRIEAVAQGGSAGPGGAAGSGGAAGPGGQSAPGTTLCGGTDPGPPGAPGAAGDPGPAGQPGRCGSVIPALGSCELTDLSKCPGA